PTDPAGQAVRRRATARRPTACPPRPRPGGAEAPVTHLSRPPEAVPPLRPRPGVTPDPDAGPRLRSRCPGAWTGVRRPAPAAPGPPAPGRVRRLRHTARQAPRLHTAHRTPTPAFGPQGEHRMSDTGTDTATTARA